VEADRLADKGRLSSPLYPNDTAGSSITKDGERPSQKKCKVDVDDAFSGSSFWLPDEAETLLNSVALVPLSDPVTFSDCAGKGEAVELDDRGYSS